MLPPYLLGSFQETSSDSTKGWKALSLVKSLINPDFSTMIICIDTLINNPPHSRHHYGPNGRYGLETPSITRRSPIPSCIENTVISFRLSPIGVDFFEDILNTTCAHDLPFFVATTLASPTEPSTDVEGIPVVEEVIGYAYALPWPASYAAYRHTVEISIYVHPEYQSVGAGSVLMDTLMTALRTTRVRDPTVNPNTMVDCDDGDGELEKADGTGRVREVLVIMSVNIEGREGGLGLERFYSRWGFERIGHMKRVGFKFGRWIDVLMLQVSF